MHIETEAAGKSLRAGETQTPQRRTCSYPLVENPGCSPGSVLAVVSLSYWIFKMNFSGQSRSMGLVITQIGLVVAQCRDMSNLPW